VRFKLDENIPEEAKDIFNNRFDVHSVQQEGLTGAEDDLLWKACQSEQRFLITQDLDFPDITSFLPGTHAGILLLRLKNPSRKALVAKLARILDEQAFEGWARCFVAATDSKIRISRP
jgi:predicted nuclease of predicted toxin-antitoxin system